ncbi:reverse transcriptase domain-containing protein [Tanacetum coccineum]
MPLRTAPKTKTTRSSPATTTTTTTPITDAQLKALIDQGIADALAARDADISRNGEDNHDSGTGVRRQAPLARDALTWWNSHVKTVGHDVAYAMTWINLKKKMTDKYCPRGEIKKLEAEMWNLKVKESDKIEKYVGGLPDMIHGSVMASKPKTMQDAIKFATELMDKRSTLLLNDRVKTKEIKMITNNNNRIRGRTLAGFMLQGLVRRNLMEDLNHYAQNATITKTANMLQNVTSTTELAI